MPERDQPVPVSVVMSAYNFAHLIRKALDSFLAQTCPVSEIIVVDDGSTDDTRAVIESYGDRVRYIWQPNSGGPCKGRNVAIRAAKNEWIGICDADDWWFPQKNERVQELLRHHPEAKFIYHPGVIYDLDGNQRVTSVYEPDALWPALRHENLISNGSCALFRRSVVLEVGGFDETIWGVEDWDLWFRIARRYPFHKIAEPLSGITGVHPAAGSASVPRMVDTARRLVDTRLSEGLQGMELFLYRHRILSQRAWDGSLELRNKDRAAARRYLLQSLADWPSPFFEPKRWWALCLTLAGRI
jgi:glycosyltransferase involved in cell wall biosynthesis